MSEYPTVLHAHGELPPVYTFPDGSGSRVNAEAAVKDTRR